MNFELQAATDAGRRFAMLCEGHEQAFFARAAHHDSEGSFPEENNAELLGSGVMAALVHFQTKGKMPSTSISYPMTGW
jgi:hypothetical protein